MVSEYQTRLAKSLRKYATEASAQYKGYSSPSAGFDILRAAKRGELVTRAHMEAEIAKVKELAELASQKGA